MLFLAYEPSTPIGSIQSIVSCLHMMVLLRQTSNKLRNLEYDNTFLQKIQFFQIAFNGDVLFELLLMLSIVHNPSQIQGMYRMCHNPSLGLTTNEMGLQECGPRR
jgi:hypothetical protein